MSLVSISSIWFFLLILKTNCQRNSAPFFSNRWNWQIEENAKIGTRPKSASSQNTNVILTAYDREGDRLEFRSEDNPESAYFTVDSATGVVKLRKPYDREAVNFSTAYFSVSDGINKAIGVANIDVKDVNDNPPVFGKSRYNVSIPEDTTVNSEVLRIVAEDPDLGAGGEIQYNMDERNGLPFRIHSRTGVLFLKEVIDFEKASNYRFVVTARDQDPLNSLSSSVIVTINIEDVQDTDPVFENLSCDLEIDENIPLRTKILTVKAVDGDRGRPNRIVYSIKSGSGKFLLDSSTGEVRVAKLIDRDELGFNGVFKLTIRATELTPSLNSKTGSYSEMSFNIKVRDLNDERPLFERTNYQLTLSENTPLGSVLPQTIFVSDADQGENGDVTMTVDWKSDGLVTLSPSTFRGRANITMILTKPLDYEKTRRHTIKIFANETALPNTFNFCVVRINVRNENDNPPIFQRHHYYVEVLENASLLTPIFRVSAKDGDAGRFGKISYSLETKSNEISISSRRGDIYLLKELDYESSKIKQYVIRARDFARKSLTSSCLLTLYVIDVNDNAPVFPNQLIDIYVKENNASRNISSIKAHDRDSPPYDVITYRLEEGVMSDYFSIQKSDDGYGVLSLEKPLDYESIPGRKINLTVTAKDLDNLHSTTYLLIHVLDENDNSPVFLQSLNFTVKEDVGGGVVLGKIEAEDRDSGQNGELSFHVTNNQSLFETVFMVDEETGKIITKPGTSPDYETDSIYYFQVTATDKGLPEQTATQNFVIRVEDVNDNKPEFESAIYHVTVNESNEPVSFRIRAWDQDSGENGVVLYTIISGNDDNIFHINLVTGLLTSVKDIDYETLGSEVKLKIKAEDQGENPLSSVAEVIISIIDINDNAPYFVRAPPLLQVTENVVGPLLGYFKAVDADSGNNSKITYSIPAKKERNIFFISSDEGELRVARGVEFDREKQEFYNLSVRASDAGSIPRHKTVSVLIQILDVNDNSPEFLDLPAQTSVEENRTITNFLRIKAIDRDARSYGRVEYSIVCENKAFYINNKTGMIGLSKPLQRVEDHKIVLHVIAYDNPENMENSRSTRSQILVTVNDMYVRKPEFRKRSPYFAFVQEELPAGTRLSFELQPLSATTQDENTSVTYTITNSSYFTINPSTAVIKTASKIDRESLSSDVIDISVRASDTTSRFSETIVSVTIKDVNDNAPRFQQNRINTRISEGVQPGDVIARMIAFDSDQGLNGEVVYEIVRGSREKFAINPNNGEIVLAPGQYLDREDRSKYRLKVVAIDRALEGQRSSTGTVVITIDDVNDSRPEFSTRNINITVIENSLVDTKVAKIKAFDRDLTSDLVYFITSVTIFGRDRSVLVMNESPENIASPTENVILSWFQFDRKTGKLRLSSSEMKDTTVDRELCSCVIFKFKVRDQLSVNEEVSESSEEAVVQINIADVNDNSPVIKIVTDDVILSNGIIGNNEEVVVDVYEEVPVGFELVAAEAIDQDQNENGKIRYELDDLTEEVVALKRNNSGTIVSIGRIDREAIASAGGYGWINFTLIASDRGAFTRRSSKLLIRIRVNDINDNNPRFHRSFYEKSVSEDFDIGSSVIQIRANDADYGDFGNIVYRLEGGANYFNIDSNTGVITLSKPLDYELTKQHQFIVFARDDPSRAWEQRETSVKVTINVRDINDNIPVFAQASEDLLIISESAPPGTSIAIIQATDADGGEYGHVTYRLSNSTEFFSINLYTGRITLSHQLVASPRHTTIQNLTVVATDGGGVESTKTLRIKILDINDHFPEFVYPTFNTLQIPEEEAAGYFVTQVNASDEDIGANGMVRYKLNDYDDGEAFSIDEITGRIVTARKLDREVQQTFTLSVEARDLGSPSLHSTKNLIVHLKDINDNKPSFPRSQLESATQFLNVRENLSIGSVVGHVIAAIDRDENAKIYYYVLSEGGSREIETFALDENKLILRKNLNREEQERYDLIIGASNFNYKTSITREQWEQSMETTLKKEDPNPIRRTNSEYWEPSRDRSLLQLTVLLDDVIDEKPKFKQSVYVTAVQVGASPGFKIIQMKAFDDDLNDKMTYSITQSVLIDMNGTKSQVNNFFINSKTGVLTSSHRLSNRESYYNLKIHASDLNNLGDDTTLEIRVVNRSFSAALVLGVSPFAIEEKQKEFVSAIENSTNTVVKVHHISAHLKEDSSYDVTRSDVRIRIFAFEKQHKEVFQKLQQIGEKLKNLFKNFLLQEISFKQIELSNSNGAFKRKYDVYDDVIILRTLTFLLAVLFILLAVIFVAAFYRMKRRYKSEIEKLEKSKADEKTSTITKNSKTSIASSSDQQDNPTASLLWSPTTPRHQSSVEGFKGNPQYKISLHASTNRSSTNLHGSDSFSS